MHLIISLILGTLFLLLLARAIIETVIGLCHIAIGFMLLAVSYCLKGLAYR